MDFGIAIFHNDPNTYFQVSYLVNVELSKICRCRIFGSPSLSNIDPEWTFLVNVTTQSGVVELQVTDQIIDKRNKYFSYTILLPSQYITDSHEYPLNKYLTYFFEGMARLLFKYEIPDNVFLQSETDAKNEMLGNSKYRLTDQEKFTERIDDIKMIEIENTISEFTGARKKYKRKD